ncbi:MAG: ABC transporter ATP-binding protein [Chthoniobacterales bacterium]|jgi:multiple sugar transport system ATP-binding protein|nr:ABC transporter ATP-binding protein [Chthoniobacterales bacterium]
MASVTFQNVTKIYRGRRGEEIPAVLDLNLVVPDHSFVVLLGPSGCGKTSTLRMLAGLESVTSGQILIGNDIVNDVPPGDRDVTMVFQNYALYPHLSVADNLAFGLRVRGLPESEVMRRVREAAAILGITELLERRPRELSGGQQQRVAVGRAIVRQPRVFLFDEPLSNLDAKMRAQLRSELIKLHQRLQTTILYVTHDQAEAMTMADTIVVLRDGTVQQAGPPLELYRNPVNTYVAGFLGSPSMNFLRGDLEAKPNGQAVFREHGEGSVEIELPASAAAAAGRDILLGLRPEDFQPLMPGEIPDAATFSAHLDIVEPTGAESICYLQTGADTLICRSRHLISTREAGHRMLFRADPARILIFDQRSGLRLS